MGLSMFLKTLLAVSLALLAPGALAQVVCLGPPAVGVSNGQWPSNCVNGTLGANCTAICNPQFTSLPAPSVTCDGTGWVKDAAAPDCKRVCDGAPATLANGRWGTDANFNCSDSISFGTACVGSCNDGFIGSPVITCPGGQYLWSQAQVTGKCVPAGGCLGPPPAVTNAKEPPASCTDGVPGQVCTYTCNANRAGVRINETTAPVPVESVCVNGGWSDPDDLATCGGPAPCAGCQPVCAGAPATIPNTLWGNCTSNIGINAVCFATCEPGYISSDPSLPGPYMVCSGTWAGARVVGRCNPTGTVACNSPLSSIKVDNAGPAPADCVGKPNGTTCVYTCNAGRVPSPAGTQVEAVCTNVGGVGVWVAPTSTCERVCATPPPTLANGAWGTVGNNNCNGTIGAGGVCNGTCNIGYPGSPSAVCTGSGWQVTGFCGALTVCTSRPATPINARDDSAGACATAGIAINASCTIQCNANSAPVPTGSQVQVQCLGDNTWSAPTGTCQRACMTSPPSDAGQVWANCAANVGLGGICSGTCPGGSPVTAKCGSGGAWIEVGQCGVGNVCTVAPTPTPVNSPDASAQACINTAVGQSCTIACNTDHAPVPTGIPVTTVCQSSPGNWSTPVSRCQRACKTDPAPLANVVWANCANNVGNGGLCPGTCNISGTVTSVTATCLNGAWGQYGSCGTVAACTNPPSPAPVNSQTTSTTCVGTPVNGVCTIPCNPLHAPVPLGTTISVTCQANNTFTRATSTCQRACTTNPPTTVNGQTVQWQPGCVAGAVGNTGICTGTCPIGTVGSPTARCSATVSSSAWTTSGSCVPQGACASVPPAVTNTIASVTNGCAGTLNGASCVYACNSGFNPNPRTGVTRPCNNGTWGAATGSCVSACPIAGIPTTGAAANVTWADNCYFLGNGQSCTGSCPGQFGQPRLTCRFVTTTNRVYDQAGSCSSTPVCLGSATPTQSVVTGTTPPTLNGAWICPTVGIGGTCPITCNSLFSGTATIQCVQDLLNAVTGARWSTTIVSGTMCTKTSGHRRFFE